MVANENIVGGQGVPDTSRRVIDVATGVLVALRGYSESEAFTELATAVRQTGVGPGRLATALVALMGGRSGPVPHQAEALDVWGDLLAERVYGRASSASTARAS